MSTFLDAMEDMPLFAGLEEGREVAPSLPPQVPRVRGQLQALVDLRIALKDLWRHCYPDQARLRFLCAKVRVEAYIRRLQEVGRPDAAIRLKRRMLDILGQGREALERPFVTES